MTDKSKDWYHELSNSQKESILKGLDDLNNNIVFLHETVMEMAKRKIQNLKESR